MAQGIDRIENMPNFCVRVCAHSNGKFILVLVGDLYTKVVVLRLKRQVEIDVKILNVTLKIDTGFYTLDRETVNEPLDRDRDIIVPALVQCNILDEQRERDEVIGRRLLQQCRVQTS